MSGGDVAIAGGFCDDCALSFKILAGSGWSTIALDNHAYMMEAFRDNVDNVYSTGTAHLLQPSAQHLITPDNDETQDSIGPIDFRLNNLSPWAVELEKMRQWHLGTVLPKFRALLPRREYLRETQLSGLSAGIEPYSQAYLRLLMLSFSNGLAGLDELPSNEICEYLQTRIGSELIEDYFRSLDAHVAQSLAEGLLNCAMKAGRSSIVDFLLSHNELRLDANKNLMKPPPLPNVPQRYRSRSLEPATPITLLQHAAVSLDLPMTKVLLKHGAAIQKSDKNGLNLLTLAVRDQNERWASHDRALYDLTRLYLKHDVQIEEEMLYCLLLWPFKDPILETIDNVIERGADNLSTNWIRSGLAYEAIRLLPKQSIVKLVQRIISSGADINCEPNYLFRAHLEDIEMRFNENRIKTARSRSISNYQPINAAAIMGMLDILQILRENGAKYTQDTFILALENGNHDLIHYLINDPEAHQHKRGFSRSLLETLCKDDFNLIPLLKQSCCMASLYCNEILLAMVYAASRDGDTAQLNVLLSSSSLEQMRLSSSLSEARSWALGFALTRACCEGNRGIVRKLMNAGAFVHIFYSPSPLGQASERELRYGIFPILSALMKRDVEMVHILLDSGLSMGLDFRSGLLARHACWMDCETLTTLVKTLTRHSVEASQLADIEHTCPLEEAFKANNLILAKLLLETGIRSIVRAETAPLCFALRTLDMATVELCIDSGEDPRDAAVLLEALCLGADWMQYILSACERKCAPRDVFGRGAIQMLIQQEKLEQLVALLQFLGRRAALNELSKFPIFRRKNEPVKESPLGTAICVKSDVRYEAARVLLEAGASANKDAWVSDESINAPSQSCPTHWISRQTPLTRSIILGDMIMIELLLAYGAKPDPQTVLSTENTPLQTAVVEGNFEIAQFLIKKGARVNRSPQAKGGPTTLQMASIGGHTGIAELLLDNGADPNVPGARVNGRTALEGAAESGRLGVTQLLLSRGANPDPNGWGVDCMPVLFARANGHFAVAELLESFITQSRAETFQLDLLLDDSAVTPFEEWTQTCVDEPLVSSREDSSGTDDDEAQGSAQDNRSSSNANRPVCHLCEQSFFNSSALARHHRTKHSSEAATKCTFCPKTFKRKDMLDRHVAGHTGAAQVVCSRCSKTFSRKDALKAHRCAVTKKHNAV